MCILDTEQFSMFQGAVFEIKMKIIPKFQLELIFCLNHFNHRFFNTVKITKKRMEQIHTLSLIIPIEQYHTHIL